MKKQIGIERAFPPRQIVETKQSALGCRAITQVRALTVAGQLYVNYAHNIQWNQESGTAEVYVGREWIPLTRIGLELWATEEGLNILNADGTVTLCVDALPDEQDTPILPMKALGGGGGGGFDEVLDEDEAVIIQAAMEYLSAMPTATMDDMSIHTLLTVGAFLMSPHNQSLQRAAVDAADRFFCSFVPIQTGGGGSGPFKSDDKVELFKMTAAEAREYARQMQIKLTALLDDLNQIPGVRATGRIDVQSEETYDEKLVLVIDDIDAGVSYAEEDVTGVLETLDELLEGWEESIPGKRFTIAIDRITFAEWSEMFADDEDGAA